MRHLISVGIAYRIAANLGAEFIHRQFGFLYFFTGLIAASKGFFRRHQ
jgi:hypothetical protein